MGLQAVYHAVDAEMLERLRAAADRLEFIESELEEDDEILSASLAKLWDGLHFALTGRSASEPGDEPSSEAIVGVHTFDEDESEDEEDDDDIFIGFSTAPEVGSVAAHLGSLVPDSDAARLLIGEKLDLPAMAAVPIYPLIWEQANHDDLVAEMSTELVALRDFYRSAADANLAVVVSIY